MLSVFCRAGPSREDRRSPARRREAGFTLIEVLVSIVVVTIGLLGVVAMQVRASNVEFESYQRGQALSLLREMEGRLAASRSLLAEFLDDSLSSTDGSVYVGSGSAGDAGRVACASGATGARAQLCEWAASLQGAAAREAGNNVGAMLGARGCVIRAEPPQDGALADLFLVVVWQAPDVGAEPPVDTPAGSNRCASSVAYGDGLRRGASLRVLVPDLTKSL